MFQDQLAHFGVEFAQNPHDFFGFGGFSKSREVTQIKKNHGDFAAMTYERIIRAASQDRLCKLRRKKSLQLGQFFKLAQLLIDTLFKLCVPLGQLRALRLYGVRERLDARYHPKRSALSA